LCGIEQFTGRRRYDELEIHGRYLNLEQVEWIGRNKIKINWPKTQIVNWGQINPSQLKKINAFQNDSWIS
jgi:hypothetical protein